MGHKRRMKEMMGVVGSFLETVDQAILERGGNPGDADFYEFECEVCGGPGALIVWSGDTFSLILGGKCCTDSLNKLRGELGIKIGGQVSGHFSFDSQKINEGPVAFLERMQSKKGMIQ